MDEDDPSRAWRGSSESVASRRSTQEGIIGHAEVDSGTEDEDEDEEEEGEGLSRCVVGCDARRGCDGERVLTMLFIMQVLDVLGAREARSGSRVVPTQLGGQHRVRR